MDQIKKLGNVEISFELYLSSYNYYLKESLWIKSMIHVMFIDYYINNRLFILNHVVI